MKSNVIVTYHDGSRKEYVNVSLLNVSVDNMGMLLRLRGMHGKVKYDAQLLLDPGDSIVILSSEGKETE